MYQLDVQNTSGIGYINQFTWVPPTSLTITAVTSTEGGHCSLVGGSIQCNGKIAPPTCTCLAGGDIVVTFRATGLEPTFNGQYWTYYGIVGALPPDPADDPGSVPHPVVPAFRRRPAPLQEGPDADEGEPLRLSYWARQDGAVAPRVAVSGCWRRVVGAYASLVGCRGLAR